MTRARSGALLPLQIEHDAASRTGTNRDTNQDAYLAFPEAGLFAVADGMGGYQDGDVASQAVIGTLMELVSPSDPLSIRIERTVTALSAINRVLHRIAAQRGPDTVIGSTAAVVVLGDDRAGIVWVGDSRIYLLRDGQLHRLTRDHTFAEQLGTEGSAGRMLTRAIGAEGSVTVDHYVTAVADGDTLLICSDGLTKPLREHHVAQRLAGPIKGLASQLIVDAVGQQARDDVTAVVVRLKRPSALAELFG